jgi:hypothetical protein
MTKLFIYVMVNLVIIIKFGEKTKSWRDPEKKENNLPPGLKGLYASPGKGRFSLCLENTSLSSWRAAKLFFFRSTHPDTV